MEKLINEIREIIIANDLALKKIDEILSNESKTVSNNEDNKRICPNCKGKIKYVPYTNIIDTCVTCGGSGQI